MQHQHQQQNQQQNQQQHHQRFQNQPMPAHKLDINPFSTQSLQSGFHNPVNNMNPRPKSASNSNPSQNLLANQLLDINKLFNYGSQMLQSNVVGGSNESAERNSSRNGNRNDNRAKDRHFSRHNSPPRRHRSPQAPYHDNRSQSDRRRTDRSNYNQGGRRR